MLPAPVACTLVVMVPMVVLLEPAGAQAKSGPAKHHARGRTCGAKYLAVWRAVEGNLVGPSLTHSAARGWPVRQGLGRTDWGTASAAEGDELWHSDPRVSPSVWSPPSSFPRAAPAVPAARPQPPVLSCAAVRAGGLPAASSAGQPLARGGWAAPRRRQQRAGWQQGGRTRSVAKAV
jgi:hypothetical protein